MNAQVIQFPANRTRLRRVESPRFIELAQRLAASTETLRRVMPDVGCSPLPDQATGDGRFTEVHLWTLAERLAAAMDYVEMQQRGMA